MKKVITFALQKGGTGKTSSAGSVAVELTTKGFKVLAIDGDPQGNLSTWLAGESFQYELADVLMKKCDPHEAIIQSKQLEKLFFLPTATLGSTLRLYSKTLANQEPFAVKHLLKTIKDDFDFIIIDTSPAFGALEESCFLASDETITVLKIDEFSSDGLITFLDNIENLKERYDTEKPKMNKIILNERDLRLVQQKDYIEKITSSINVNFSIIPVDQAFKKAQSIHIPIQMLEGTKPETLKVISDLAESLITEE